jgi:hypothetical protein
MLHGVVAVGSGILMVYNCHIVGLNFMYASSTMLCSTV